MGVESEFLISAPRDLLPSKEPVLPLEPLVCTFKEVTVLSVQRMQFPDALLKCVISGSQIQRIQISKHLKGQL